MSRSPPAHHARHCSAPAAQGLERGPADRGRRGELGSACTLVTAGARGGGGRPWSTGARGRGRDPAGGGRRRAAAGSGGGGELGKVAGDLLPAGHQLGEAISREPRPTNLGLFF